MWWPTRAEATSTTCIAKIDEFAYEKSFLINVGDEKGELLDAAVRRANPAAGAGAGHLLRLRLAADRPRGAVGQGVLRRARRPPMPKWRGASGRTPASTTASPVWSAPSATAARRSTRWPPSTASPPASWTCCSSTTTRPPTCPTCRASCDRGWLHRGSIVVADNVADSRLAEVPRVHEREQQGKLFDTVEHKTHGEYQSLRARPGARVGVPSRLTARGRSASPRAWTAWPCSRCSDGRTS